MNSSSSRGRWFKLQVVAAGCATVATIISHLYVIHGFHSDLDYIAPTLIFDKYLGLGQDDLGWPDDLNQYPLFKSYVDMIIARTTAEKCPNNRITMLWTGYFGVDRNRGWPFASGGWPVIVQFDCVPKNTCRYQGIHQFHTGETGPTTIRFKALLANWFVYFLISTALITTVCKGLTSIRTRRRRKSMGFPIDLS